ncbi:MAG: prolipoprotein diacylglyceryl transferase [Puniceicoccaceae bacterium]
MNAMLETSRAVNYWTHDLSPFLVQFPDAWPWPLGGNGIRWYGLAYIAGFAIAYLLLLWYHRKKQSPYGAASVADLATYLILGVMIGGRLGFMLFYDFELWLHEPLSIFQIWRGGMSSHGGMIGVTIAAILFARQRQQSAWQIGDLIVTITPPGLMLGRLANFMNGELWGNPTTVPWAVIFPEADGLPRHPSQLYQAATEGLLLFCYIQLRFWGKLGPRPLPGQLIGEFLIAYSIVRIGCEFFREPDASLILGFSRGQFYSIGTLIAGVIVIGVLVIRKRSISGQ